MTSPALRRPRLSCGPRLAARLARVADALLERAQPSGSGVEAQVLADRPAAARLPRPSRRQLAAGAAALAGVAALLVLTGDATATLAEALDRALHAQWSWVAAGILFEALSFAGASVLLWLVAGRATPAIGVRASGQITLAGAAVTRLLPTAGLGGVALTLWALVRAGLKPPAAVRTLLTYLVLLYAVFMAALATGGALLASGIVRTEGPALAAGVPALLALALVAAALWLGRTGAGAFGDAVRDAMAFVRRADVRLLGAPAWWGFDLAVLASTFAALGAPPHAAVLVVAYFTGAVANTIPLPGMVAGGTTAVLFALGSDPALALSAVLAYRAIALWLPALLGAAVLPSLRRTVVRWDAGSPAVPRASRLTMTPA